MAKPFKKQKSLNFKLYLENTAPNSFRSKGKKKCYICATLDAINIPLKGQPGRWSLCGSKQRGKDSCAYHP